MDYHNHHGLKQQAVVGSYPVPITTDRTGVTDIYPVLAKHQREENWVGREMVGFLQAWAERFNQEFKLGILKVVLCVDRLPATCFGHFRLGHNGFGLEGEIAINSRYLVGQRPMWEILGTLLHELIHAWQAAHGTPSRHRHHNAEFRQKALEFGLMIDADGVTSFAANGSFKELLHECGIEVPQGHEQVRRRPERGVSKLKKYSCGCTNVRVATANFRAVCLLCGNEFLHDDTSGRPKGRANTETVRQ